MAIELSTPDVDRLAEAVAALREWQHDDAAFQLHPGDVGWFWQFGAQATAAAVRTWSRDGRLVAVGLLDGPQILRMTTSPDTRRDEELARRVATDLVPDGGVLPDGAPSVEAPVDALVHEVLADEGWATDEPWTPLQRDLAEPVEDPGVRIEVVGRDGELGGVADRIAVHRASFDGSKFSDERWRTVAAGPLYADARCLVAYDSEDVAVAAATVWSAGPGRPGLLEPVGTHADHRGKGYGRAITVAAARTLRELGSSTAVVCTPSSNVGAVATYASAGFRRLPERLDRRRDPSAR